MCMCIPWICAQTSTHAVELPNSYIPVYSKRTNTISLSGQVEKFSVDLILD